MLPNFKYVRPGSVEEAIDHLTSEGARVHAGGTDLLGCLRDNVFGALKVVSINALDDLRGIRQTPDRGVRIGALATITQVENHELINERYKGLAMGASEVASPQLRNQGTIGGNICQKPRCWYYRGEFHCIRKGGNLCYAFGGENQFHCIFGSDKKCCIVHPSDIAPALVAFDARVRVSGHKGDRLVPIEKFYVLPGEDVERETVLEAGEIVTEIILPPIIEGTRSSYRKVRARRSWDFALAGVALALVLKGGKVESGRVVLSGAAPVPWRSHTVEKVIIGQKLDSKTITRAAETAVHNAEPLAKNSYKIPLFKAIIEEELTKIAIG
ncbi:MAG: xanthine dehydrogenase family protein subunit M [Desulfomonile tiedjei]|uniref:Xanthine dehydrogenase family protein subunit M n=1 Tax=Desulfomonile tiedjei TaxID=2358 RepID=A0A9D6Z4Q3_9BACT|nr:xanthine dehydrogenase family protein subunit M [Desulfomonile tiedjei]